MRLKPKQMILASLFAALTAIAGFIRLPIPGVAVMFSMQPFIVLLAGMLLRPATALASQLVYIAVGLAGIPVFTQGGGIGYVLSPSFGYLVGFAIAAPVTGVLLRRFRLARFLSMLVAGAAGIATLYLTGTFHTWLILNLHLGTPISYFAVWLSCLPLIALDAVKIVLAASISVPVSRSLKSLY